MSSDSAKLTSFGFAKTFVLPGLMVFLVPVVSLLFFLHAQSRFNARARESVLSQIRSDATLTPEQRARATTLFTDHPFSELLQNREFADDVDSTMRFHFATFKWMIRLSKISIVAGVAVFLVAGLCVLFSMRSQRVQYLSLSAGWHVLRIYGALQAAVQGILLVALSFWVTALWFERFSVKLVGVTAILAFAGVIALIVAIFKRIDTTHVVDGKVIENSGATPLWQHLSTICTKVGTAPPDHIIAGIDDNFFVTEHPVVVDGKPLKGRTLYVSLSLLRQLNGREADAVLAHEMAHFSGEDTLYSKKISPLLRRFGAYLEALYKAGITLPIFYFMLCFRAMFEMSLNKLSRQRELRADRIAAETTSGRDFTGAMLRIVAYSKFRNQIQQSLFNHEQALLEANISQQIGEGFHSFAHNFAADPNEIDAETVHPFDSHPPLAQRLEAVGVPLSTQIAREILAEPGDGSWFDRIENAAEIESQQWREFENNFRSFHEETLAYRFFPETDEERAIVVKAFPQVSFEGKKGTLVIDCDGIQFTEWSSPIAFCNIAKCSLNDSGVLEIKCAPSGKATQKLPTKSFGTKQQAVLDTINRYYSRW